MRSWLARLFFAAVGSALLVPVAAVPPAFAAQPTAGLRVSGNTIEDATGRAVLLHGIDVSGTEFSCAQGGARGNEGWAIFGDQPVDTPQTIAVMRSWNANAVRVPLNEDCWLGINGINPKFGGAAYVSAISKFVGDLRASGMYVILDLHWNAPGAAVALSQQPMADADHSVDFWKGVASTFRSDAGVIFDLYNEPFLYASYMQDPRQDAWACWLEGCSLNQYLTGGHPYTRNLAWRTAGMQQLLDAVRSTGAANMVLASGLDWANDDSGWLAHRPVDRVDNTAAGWHEYGGEACSHIDCWSRTIAPLSRRVPVVISETGDHAGSGCTLTNMPVFLPWADSNGLSYLAWTFNPWRDSHDVLITNWNGSPTQCEGQYYSTHLAQVAANPPAVQPRAAPAADTAASAGGAGGVSLWRLASALAVGAVMVALAGLVTAVRRSRKRAAK